jgi:phosphoenolpyruvate synthase/pyruvate phosphate dikinase
MCEIPNNVILGEEFAGLFDGFSIGSNDLTQLALGVDRDSELLAHIFDERDPGVKRLIRMIVETASDGTWASAAKRTATIPSSPIPGGYRHRRHFNPALL